MPLPLPTYKVKFIIENEGLMKQKEIARQIGCTPAAVCKILKKGKVVEGFFDVDSFSKLYIA